SDVALVQHRLGDGAARHAAVDAWKALKRHCDGNERLRALISEYQNEREADLAKEASRLRSEIDGDGQRADILYSVETDVSALFPMLMLFPETGLLSYIIDELETAAAADDGL